MTIASAGGVAKTLVSQWNSTVRGIKPREKGQEFRIKWGLWVRYATDNFSTEKPEVSIRVKDVLGGDYNITDAAKMNIFGNGDYGETKVNAIGYTGTINSVVVSTTNPRNTIITSTSATFTDQVKVGMFVVNTTAGSRLGAKAVIKSVNSNSSITVDGDSFDALDTFTIEAWQYIGGLHSIQNDLVTGDALESIRMQISLETTAADCSSSNRIIDISEPSIEFMYAASEANDMYIDAPANLSHANVSNPPTDSELNNLFGLADEVGAGFTSYIDDNGAGIDAYRVWSDGVNWWYDALIKAT